MWHDSAMIWKQLAALTLAATIGGASAEPQTPPSLAEMVKLLDARRPDTPGEAQAMLGTPLKCDAGFCNGGPISLRDVKIGRIDFRQLGNGPFLALDSLSGGCIAPDSLSRKIALSIPMNGCSDGFTCMYRFANRPWGRFSVSVPNDPEAKQCAQSVIFDAMK